MVKTFRHNGVSRIVAQGELDRADCPRLRAEFQQAAGRLDLDLVGVGFIDSSCAKLVSDETEKLRNEGCRLYVKASPQVLRTLEMLAKAGLKSARELLTDLKMLRGALV